MNQKELPIYLPWRLTKKFENMTSTDTKPELTSIDIN